MSMTEKASSKPLNSFSAQTYNNSLTELRRKKNLPFPLSVLFYFFSLPFTFHSWMKKITPLHLDLTFLNTAPGNAMGSTGQKYRRRLCLPEERSTSSPSLNLPSHGNANPSTGFDWNTRLLIGGGDMFNSYINIKRLVESVWLKHFFWTLVYNTGVYVKM